MTRNQTCMSSTTRPIAHALSMHKESHTISKAKPKIRIIHIFAPEIIKTDVANFRELVQRLTGKPTENGGKKKSIRRGEEPRIDHLRDNVLSTKMEFRTGSRVFGSRERVKEEGGIWNGENSGGFLGGFADLEGFIEDLGDFPLLPNLDSNSHIIHGFEGSQLA